MKEKINYIHKNIIERKSTESIRSNIIKNYLIFYIGEKKKTHSNDKINKNIIHKTRVIKNLPKNSKKIILLNNELVKFEQLNEIKIFTKINKEISNDIKNFFIDCIYPNLNFNYIENNLSLQNKIFIKIPKNTHIDKTIHIININKKQINKKSQRIYLILDENSKIDILNYYINKNKNLSNNMNINIFLKKDSNLNYKIVNINNKKITHNTSIYAKQLTQSNFTFTELSLEKDNLNSHKFFFLLGRNSTLNKKAGYILDNKTKCNIICKISHYENESKSNIIIKTTNINSEINFKGHIEVGLGIEKTQSKLVCNGIMLSREGSIEFKPELAINNNNVICSHAATIGYIDKNIIKYMQSRGLEEKECINALMKIFFYDISNNEKILSNILNNI